MGALLRCESLNGIPEHCPGHMPAVLVKEICQSQLVAFADFAEHPAHSLLYKVMSRVKKHSGKFHGVIKLIIPYESQG